MKKKEEIHYPVRGWCLQKWVLRMRILVVMLLVSTMNLYSSDLAWAQKVSIHVNNADLKSVISLIELQTNLGFLYYEEEIRDFKNLSLDVKNTEVQDVLKQLLAGTNLKYYLDNETILITAGDRFLKKGTEEMQAWKVSGTVTDQKKNPLPGVSVYIKGTSSGVATDVSGSYKIVLPAQKGIVLVFSFVGMKTRYIPVEKEQVLNIIMEEENSGLDEVTVVAYGERKKRELVGAISSVKSTDLEDVPTASFENLLQGHMSGVEVQNVSGAPGGGGSVVRIRGYNSMMIDGINNGSPLYVVDGIPINSFTSPITGTNTLAEIDPATIESVEVLKDAASAAIYGSRASNGVILITTKKGKTGRGKFSANVSYSYSILPETPVQVGGSAERMLHIMMARNERMGYWNWPNGYKFPESYTDSYMQDGAYDYFWNSGFRQSEMMLNNGRILQDSLNPFYNNSTNWWKYCFRPGKIWNANLQTSGGTDMVKYMVGAGWYNEHGIMLGSDFARANLITNLNITPRERLNMDVRLYVAYTDRSRGAAYSGFGGAPAIEGLTVDPKSNSTLLPGGGAFEEAALRMINQTMEKNKTLNLRGNVQLGYEFIRGLKLSSSLAIDYTLARKNAFTPSYLDAFNNFSVSTGQAAGNTMLTNENLLSYTFNVKERHNFDLLLGLSYTHMTVDQISGSGQNSPSDNIHYVPDGFPTIGFVDGTYRAMQSYSSNFEESKMLSYFGRLAYNWDKKYLFEATLRRDGSSVFGKDVRWATFPSVALGWAFSEEKFMDNLWWLSFGKIRGSWGTSGQQFMMPYLAHGTLDVGSKFLGNTGLLPTSILNRELTWEKSDQYDIGLDVDFLDYRLKVKLDYYYKYSKSLLYNVDMPGNVYGLDNAWQNAMELSNEGLELEVSGEILRNTAVTWRARFNASRNWNRFEKSYTDMDIDGKVVGRPLYGLYVYQDKGIIRSEKDVPVYFDQDGNKTSLCVGNPSFPFRPGMRLIGDLNNDGIINEDDKYYAKSTLPVVHGGIANEVKWNGFDLNVLFTYTIGRHIMNIYSINSLSFDGRVDPVFADYSFNDFWQKEGDQTKYPTMQGGKYQYTGQFDCEIDSNIENVHYMRLKQLTLGYNLPNLWLKRLNIDGVRLFFTGENLFLLTNYSGIDPESVEPELGKDYFKNYPLARKLSLGLTVNF